MAGLEVEAQSPQVNILTVRLTPLDFEHEFASLPSEVALKLSPTYEAITGVRHWVSETLVREKISETEINQYLDGKVQLSPRFELSPQGERFKNVADQYEHIRQVNET